MGPGLASGQSFSAPNEMETATLWGLGYWKTVLVRVGFLMIGELGTMKRHSYGRGEAKTAKNNLTANKEHRKNSSYFFGVAF